MKDMRSFPHGAPHAENEHSRVVDQRPSAVDFEMAYQARVAIDRIRFAIKVSDQALPTRESLQEIGIQLLDALERLENAERHFQARSRNRVPRPSETDASVGAST
jgi:hypothetical protein